VSGLIGDPTQLSDKDRAKGHADVVATMPDYVAKLTKASGTVADHRRIVAFVYLLLRDNMPCGKLSEIMARRYSLTPELRTALFGGFDAAVLWGCVARLTDSTDEALRVTILEWVALVFRFSDDADALPALFALLPEADDTETVFTNGWLAQYAKYVADDLCNPPYANART